MNLKHFLQEGTYNLSGLQDLFDFFEKKVSKRFNLPLINITNFFKEYIGDKKVFVWLNFGSRKEALLAGVGQNKNTVVIVVDRKKIRDGFKNDILMDENEALIRAFKHEVIHVLDYIRQVKYGENNKPKFIEVSSKRNKPSDDGMSETYKLLRYLNNDYEFNRIVNEIQEEKRNDSRFWQGLKEAKFLDSVLDFFLRKLVLFGGNADFDDLLKDLSKLKDIISKDKNLVKKIITRLSREDLIPSYRGLK